MFSFFLKVETADDNLYGCRGFYLLWLLFVFFSGASRKRRDGKPETPPQQQFHHRDKTRKAGGSKQRMRRQIRSNVLLRCSYSCFCPRTTDRPGTWLAHLWDEKIRWKHKQARGSNSEIRQRTESTPLSPQPALYNDGVRAEEFTSRRVNVALVRDTQLPLLFPVSLPLPTLSRLSPVLVEQATELFVAKRVVVRLEEDVGRVFWTRKSCGAAVGRPDQKQGARGAFTTYFRRTKLSRNKGNDVFLESGRSPTFKKPTASQLRSHDLAKPMCHRGVIRVVNKWRARVFLRVSMGMTC